MKTNMLKINAMKKFVKFIYTNAVHLNLWNEYNPAGKIYAGLEKRQATADKRFKFCCERSHKRPSWKDCYLRWAQELKAEKLLKYIQNRKDRKK